MTTQRGSATLLPRLLAAALCLSPRPSGAGDGQPVPLPLGAEAPPPRPGAERGVGPLGRSVALLQVETAPPGMRVTVDDAPVGRSPLAGVELRPGEHRVAIEDPCWARDAQRVVVAAGEERTVRFTGVARLATLELSAPPAAPGAPPALASVDGRPLGPLPGTWQVPACSRRAAAAGPAGTWEAPLELVEGKVARLRVTYAAAGAPPPASGHTPSPSGEEFTEPKSGLVFVRLPGGPLVGGNYAGHVVRPFALGKTEVTAAAWARCVAAGACTPAGRETHCTAADPALQDHPVNCVDWAQALAFCRWLGGRLPSSEEWEWAASGGEGREYPWGAEEPAAQACWKGDRSGGPRRVATCQVGSHPEGRSKHGLLDLAGNVWEWTAADLEGGKEIRGGGFSFAASPLLRSTYRGSFRPAYRFNYLGLRCAL